MSETGNPDPQDLGPDSIYRAPESKTGYVPQDDALAAYVGPKNAAYYAKHFDKFRQGGSSVSWNWPSFFLSTVWLLYRKMWLLAFLYWFVLPITLTFISGAISAAGSPESGVLFYYGGYLLIGFVLLPMFANRLYYDHARKKTDKVAAATSSPEQQAIELARIGGTSNVALVVVPFFLIAIVGILAAIAIPAYQDYTIRAQVSEGLSLSAGAKAAVTEYYLDTNELPRDNAELGLDDPDRLAGSYVTRVAVRDGSIIVTYGRQAHPLLTDKTLALTPAVVGSDSITWGCYSENIERKHVPAACR